MVSYESVRTKNMKGTIIDSLDQNQLEASNMNADLRKKLRIDRVRKMTTGTSAVTASLDDENMPYHIKEKSLRDIQMIRETKKNDIVNSVFSSNSSNTATVHFVPGRPSIIVIPLVNDGNRDEVFSIAVQDPDDQLLLAKNERGEVEQKSEFYVSTSKEELMQLVKQGKIQKP